MANKPDTATAAPLHDLAVIGSGMAGLAASLFAAKRGLSTVQAGNTGGILFDSGLLDLLGVHPIAERRLWEDPWAGIEALVKDIPSHPYAYLTRSEIQAAFDELLGFFKEAGMVFRNSDGKNSRVLTGVGTIKHSYYVPESMWPGVEALAAKKPCLLVDFEGLREYSARQIAQTVAAEWPGLRTARLVFPGTEKRTEIYTAHLAQALELPETRKKLGELIRPIVNGAQAVGLPAILGIKRTPEILRDLAAIIGAPVFEIPTLPTSVPGLRQKEIFDALLPRMGVRRLIQKRVTNVSRDGEGIFTLTLDSPEGKILVRARGVILATGRFMGKGLIAEREGIREALLNLPVFQPTDREYWHHGDFFNPKGHEVNLAGIETDRSLRPIDREGTPVYPNLYAAGIILAHQDWTRMKCGTGLAISTAYKAVQSFISEHAR